MKTLKKEKILIISPNRHQLGGISSVVDLYYKNIEQFNYNLTFLSTYNGHSVFNLIFNFIIFLSKYIFYLFNSNVKIVHIHSSFKGSFLRKSISFLFAKIFHKKIIFHIHSGRFDVFYEKSSIFIKKIIECILNYSNIVFVLSSSWKNKISKISNNKNIIVLYNPTQIHSYSEKYNDKLKVIFMGKIGEKKGIYDILDSIKYLNNNIEINLYGDGEIEKVKNIIKNNNLEFKIKIKSWVKDKEKDEIFKNSDVLILPSYNEGLPMSILEGMSYGLAIIATDVGGILEAVKNNENGFIINTNSPLELAQKLNFLENNRKICNQMGKKSYIIAKEKFSIEKIIEELNEYYKKLLISK